MREFLSTTLALLQEKPVDQLLDERYARYRKLGVFEENKAESSAGSDE